MKKRNFLTRMAALVFALALAPASLAGQKGEGYKDERHGEGEYHQCPHKKHSMERAVKKLDLNDEQRAKFVEVMQTQHQKKEEIIEASGIKEALRAHHEETMGQLATVLDEEQLEKFRAHHAKHKSRRCKHGHGEHDKHGSD